MSFVYGSATIRLPGEGVAISVAERASGNHAVGWRAATSVKGANRSPMARRCSTAE